MSESTGGALSGAGAGAQAGAAFGPWGAVIGAVIGGVVGALSGKKKKLARKYAEKAAKTRRQQQQMRAAVQRRDTVRQARMARAQAVAAGASDTGVSSSAVMGATSSIASQTGSAIKYFDSQVQLDNLYQQYAKKAGKYARQGDEMMSMLGAATQAAPAVADLGGFMQGSGGGYSSFNNTAAVTNMQGHSAFNTFGSTLNLGS
jgi:hypothetical protein